jgi:ABC-type uncharacterized transport system auxiliary subunit
MKRRATLLGLPLAIAGCGLSERPYVDQRQWPLVVPNPDSRPPSPNGLVMELRDISPAPGLETRGLQTLRADGSIVTAFYEQWAVPPAEGVEDQLRRWLAQSGQFRAVVSPGTRADPAVTVSGELTVLWTDAAAKVGRAAIALTAIDVRSATPRVMLQRTFSASASDGTSQTPPATVQAQLAALGDIFGQIAAALG